MCCAPTGPWPKLPQSWNVRLPLDARDPPSCHYRHNNFMYLEHFQFSSCLLAMLLRYCVIVYLTPKVRRFLHGHFFAYGKQSFQSVIKAKRQKRGSSESTMQIEQSYRIRWGGGGKHFLLQIKDLLLTRKFTEKVSCSCKFRTLAIKNKESSTVSNVIGWEKGNKEQSSRGKSVRFHSFVAFVRQSRMVEARSRINFSTTTQQLFRPGN